MGQETGSYIADLVVTNPVNASDTVSSLGGQHRFTKNVLRKSFPGFTGAVACAGTTTGSADAYVLTPTTALVSYKHGMSVVMRANFTNTGACTLNISALGAKDIKNTAGAAMVAGLIVSGQFVTLVYDETAGYFVAVGGIAAATSPVLLATLTASSSASLSDTTSLTTAYQSYEFRLINVVPATDAAVIDFNVSVDGGANWKTDGTYRQAQILNWPAATANDLNNGVTNTRGEVGIGASNVAVNGGTNGLIRVERPWAVGYKTFWTEATQYDGANLQVVSGAVLYNGVTTAINAIKFSASTGNITSGDIQIWGIP